MAHSMRRNRKAPIEEAQVIRSRSKALVSAYRQRARALLVPELDVGKASKGSMHSCSIPRPYKPVAGRSDRGSSGLPIEEQGHDTDIMTV